MHDLDWRSSHYGAVHAVLAESVGSPLRHLAPGTEGALGRARAWFQAGGQAGHVARLDAISVTICKLQLAQRAQDHAAYHACESVLGEMAAAWLADAPMFPNMAAIARVERAA
jgi:hypothetical protein